MNPNLLGKWLLVLAAALAGSSARADFLYSFAFEQSNYTVAPGGTVDVKVFLEETISGSSVSRLGTTGMLSAGVKLLFNDNPPTQPAALGSVTDIVFNPAFNSTLLDLRSLSPGAFGQLTEAVALGSPLVKGKGGPTTFEVLIGTFHFTAGSVPDEVTHLRATVPSIAANVAGGTVLDKLIHDSTATISVSSVPEPASVTLLALGVLTAACYARRRRQPDQRPYP
jgi:hypothetical protein